MPGTTIRYVGLVRNAVGLQEEIIDLPGDATVRDLLGSLAERHGESFRASVFAVDGKLGTTTKVLLDGVDMEEVGGLDAHVGDGERVAIVVLVHPFVGG